MSKLHVFGFPNWFYHHPCRRPSSKNSTLGLTHDVVVCVCVCTCTICDVVVQPEAWAYEEEACARRPAGESLLENGVAHRFRAEKRIVGRGGGGVRSLLVVHGRVPIIDLPSPRGVCRWKRAWRPSAALIFPGVFRTHAVYHWPPGHPSHLQKGRCRPGVVYARRRARPSVAASWCLFWRGRIASRSVARARSLSPRLTLAALRSHRIPARWSHWTGPPLIFFYYFFIFIFSFSYPPPAARTRNTHAHASYAPAPLEYGFVHTYAAFTWARAFHCANVCASATVAFSFLFLAIRSAAAGLR